MPRGSQISHKTSKKGLKHIQISIAVISHLVATPTRRLIALHATHQIFDLFGLSKCKWGNAPSGPSTLIKISLCHGDILLLFQYFVLFLWLKNSPYSYRNEDWYN